MNKLVAFSGFKSSGKSTATQFLLSRGWIDIKLAHPLKQMLVTMYTIAGISEADAIRRIEGDLKEVPDPVLLGKTPRHAMQTLGTEWRNMIGENLWVEIWKRAVIQQLKHTNVVCSDVRFEPEIRALRELGGQLVWIDRPGTHSDGHASEVDISEHADFTIKNNGPVSQLESAIVTKLLQNCDNILLGQGGL